MPDQHIGNPCDFNGCERIRKHASKGLCSGHLKQRRRGQPLRPLRKQRPNGSPPVIEWDEVPCPREDLIGPCHIFRGAKLKPGKMTTGGYGVVRASGKTVLVHRYVWEQKYGPIEDKMEIDHQCRVRACCNVDHLRVVTHKVNGSENAVHFNSKKTHCPQGHPYNEENTVFYTHKGVRGRYCRACRKIRWHRRKTKKPG